MPDGAARPALLRLMTWLSPAFPVGAFSYSHGLERAIHNGVIHDRKSLVGWLTDIVERGSGWNDAVLLAEAWRQAAAGEESEEVAELAEAMAGSRERHMETTLQGEAFASAIEVWNSAPKSPSPLWGGVRGGGSSGTDAPMYVAPEAKASEVCDEIPPPLTPPHKGEGDIGALPYPVAIGATAAAHSIALEPTLAAYLHAFTSNLIQAAIRLVPLGQRDGVAAIAAMEPVILTTAERAAQSSLDDLGSATFLSEIAAMKHEVQYSRVFRS